MRYWHCFGLDGLVCLEFFFGYKWCYKLKKVIKPSRAKTTWTDSKYRNLPQGVDEIGVKVYSYELCQEKERSGWWHVNNVKLVCAEKMRNVSFFNILVCLLLRYEYSFQYDYLWLYLCHLMCLTLYLFHVEHSTGGSKYCH